MIRIPKSWEPPGESRAIETQKMIEGPDPHAKIDYQTRRAKIIAKDKDPLSLWFRETWELSRNEATMAEMIIIALGQKDSRVK